MRYRICLGNVAFLLGLAAIVMALPILVSLAVAEYDQTVAFAAATIVTSFIAGAHSLH